MSPSVEVSDDFSIDRNFVRFGDTTYATNKITSYRVNTRKELKKGANSRLLFGLLAVFVAFVALGQFRDGSIGGGIIAILLTAGLAFAAYVAQNRPATEVKHYSLALTTNAGEMAAFETTSQDTISRVKLALERAMAAENR